MNPYAIVALVTAGLAMFPVAILFGLIAFGRRGGRLIAAPALLLGLADVGLVAAAIVLAGPKFSGFTVSVSRSAVSAGVTTGTPAPPTSPSAPSSAAHATSAPGTAARPASGAPCQKSQALLLLRTDAGPLICYAPGPSGDCVWSAPQPLAGGVYNRGEPCDPAQIMGYVGRTADAHALACKGAGRNTTRQDWP